MGIGGIIFPCKKVRVWGRGNAWKLVFFKYETSEKKKFATNVGYI